ncbi:MAG: hypothetical protein ABWK01_07750 [Infirmifilum sp.]
MKKNETFRFNYKAMKVGKIRGVREVIIFDDEGMPLSPRQDLKLPALGAVIISSAGKLAELLGKGLTHVEIHTDNDTAIVLAPLSGKVYAAVVTDKKSLAKVVESLVEGGKPEAVANL